MINNISERHHYLPVFFIRGFIAPATKIWIYDKERDLILKNPQAPKSIFYERDRNNIFCGSNHKSDILETTIYNRVDSTYSNHLREIQKADLEKIEHAEFIVALLFNIAFTYYRLPVNNELTARVIKATDAKQLPPDYKELWSKFDSLDLSEVDIHKLRSSISTLLDFFQTELKKGKINYKITDHDFPSVILADNPILHKNVPKDFNDLTESLIFPITEKRLYFGLDGNNYKINEAILKRINMCLALQSERFFGSSSKVFLESLVKGLKYMKGREEYLLEMKQELFDMINDK